MKIDLGDKDRKLTIEYVTEDNKTEQVNAIILFEYDEIADYKFAFYITEDNDAAIFKVAEDNETLMPLEQDEENLAEQLLFDFLDENEFFENGKPIDIYDKINTYYDEEPCGLDHDEHESEEI